MPLAVPVRNALLRSGSMMVMVTSPSIGPAASPGSACGLDGPRASPSCRFASGTSLSAWAAEHLSCCWPILLAGSYTRTRTGSRLQAAGTSGMPSSCAGDPGPEGGWN